MLTFSRLSFLSMMMTAVFGLQVGVSSTAKAEGSDGVELEIVPVDAGVDCSSIILKGTRRFEGTAFVMPRVIVGVTKENEDLFQIVPDGSGGYLLSMGLYFPSPGESLDLRAGRSNLYLHGCNFERALHQINKDIPDKKPKVTRLARLPVRNIEVIIDGVSDRATIGEVKDNGVGDETSILNYEGTDHTVEFVLSASEKEGLLRRLERKQGISIKVNMKFSARESDGALYAEVDLESLAQNLQANLKGKYMVGSGELKSALNNALANTRISVTTEGGSKSALFDKISDNLMTLVTANVSDATVPAADTTPKPSTPSGPDVTDALPANIKVDAVVSLLRSQKKRVVNYSNTTALQTHVYTTPVNFRARLQDPDTHLLYIRADERPAMVPGSIMTGDKVTISVSREFVESITYRPIESYLTADQISRFELSRDFPHILEESFVLHNEDTKQGFFAVGKQNQSTFLSWRLNVKDLSFEMDRFKTPRYFWLRTEWMPVYNDPKSQAVPPTLEGLKALALQAMFTKLGTRRFTLGELVQDNSAWSAKFDELGGKVELTAKRDLGYLTITGYAPPPKKMRVMDQIQEETREPGKPPVRSEAKRVREQIVPVSRAAYMVYVSRPSKGEATQSATPLLSASESALAPAVVTAP